ncbi:MAG TPA: alpha/beta hydrolase [Candidatus Limnocylindrales bacterium]|jgi:pimeloyl-ACP methyl ester carboxylesterase|nr:alpha/beta hydrolase [Candidatus Limnocylindrales bacterium]
MATPRQVATLAVVVAAGVALGIGIDVIRVGGIDTWLDRHRPPVVYERLGRRVDIGGRALYLDCRGQGSPTVVLESGMGDGAGGWGSVLDASATTTRTCAYDRAGRGSSDPRGRHTATDAAADLRALLAAAGERPPFIVVGHSLGEAYARVFASRYRTEMRGIVMVDGFSPDLQVDAIEPLLGALRPEYQASLQSLRDLVARVEDLDWATSEAQLRAADVSGLPLEVLRAPREEPRLDEAANRAIAAAWQDAYGSLSPGRLRYEIAWGAGHIIQADRPDLVIAAIDRSVRAARD